MLRRSIQLPRNFSSFLNRCFSTPATSANNAAQESHVFREVQQTFTNISYSPIRMNLVAKQLRRLTVKEAIAQAMFTPKKGGIIAQTLIEKAAVTADRKYKLSHNDLFLDELFVTQGPGTKRVKFMGRGRTGIKFTRSSHLTESQNFEIMSYESNIYQYKQVKLKEIDFEHRIATAPNERQRLKWTKRRDEAQAIKDALKAEADGDQN